MNYNLLTEMCVFCNNWFNPGNTPIEFDMYNILELPSAFLALHTRIQEFLDNEDITKDNTLSERVGDHTESIDLNYSAWQVAFKRELALYKRARFI